MNIEVERQDRLVIISPVGRLDASSSPELRNCFDDLIIKGERNYLLDMESVDCIDSFGLAALIRIFKKVRVEGGELKLCNTKPNIFRIMEITRLIRVFDIFPDRSSAVQSF